MSEMHPLTQAVIDGDKATATELTQKCLDEGEAANFIVEERLVPGMAVIGEQFQCDEIFVPEMLIAANAMKASLALLEPLIAESGVKAPYTAVIGTVQGDLHDIGLDGYDPLEAKADMDVVELRERPGHRLTFCGNSDMRVWERGDPDELRGEVLHRLRAAYGGSYVFMSDHSVSSDVSGQTYDLIVKTVREYGNYPLDLPSE